MSFVDEIKAVAEQAPKVTAAQKREISRSYCTREWDLRDHKGDRLQRYLSGRGPGSIGYWANTHTNDPDNIEPISGVYKPEYLHQFIGPATDAMVKANSPRSIADLLGYAKAAERTVKSDNNRIELNRLAYEMYMACQKALGDIWGYDRVSVGTYKSQRGHVRQVIESFVRKQPQDAQWALDTLHKYERQPDQMKFDFAK